MWPIIKQELKDRRWSLIAFCLGSLAMLWLYVATFISSQNSMAQLQELVKTYPKGLLDAIGLSNLNLDTVEKYLNAKHFSMLWPLMAIILALSRSGNQIAEEIQSGTLGLTLAMPLQRWKIFMAKYSSGLITILIFTAVSVFGVIPLAAAYNIPTHFNILFSTWILTIIFMWAIYSLSLLVSAWVNDKAKVYATVSSFLILSYAAYIASLITDNLNFLKYYSVFYYFNTQEVLASGHIMLRSWALYGAIIVITSVVAAWRFNQRDISV